MAKLVLLQEGQAMPYEIDRDEMSWAGTPNATFS